MTKSKVPHFTSLARALVDLFGSSVAITQTDRLTAIAETQTIETPKIICNGTDDGEDVGYSFLLLDYIPGGEKNKNFWEPFWTDLSRAGFEHCGRICVMSATGIML